MGLSALTPSQAGKLAERLAQIDPWKRLGQTPQAIEGVLRPPGPSAWSYLIRVEGKQAGVVVLRAPWLLGVYLNFFCVLPEYQGSGVGASVLRWLERESGRAFGNIWVCTSAFNKRAAAYYRSHGFARVAKLEDLIVEGEDELLMRKRI